MFKPQAPSPLSLSDEPKIFTEKELRIQIDRRSTKGPQASSV